MTADPLTLGLVATAFGLAGTKKGKQQLGRIGVKPSIPAALPKPPTLNEAGKNRDEFDRIRRRRGVLANIFSSSASSTPAVGGAQLLGQ